MKPNVYSPKTLAREWACSERHIRNLINDGQLPAWRAGGKLLRISAEAAEEFKKSHMAKVQATGETIQPERNDRVNPVRVAQILTRAKRLDI